jgi:phosphoribosylaminoimidazole-succinocarboxamide synthase
MFTPATKAEMGDHDENIDYATVEKLIGAELAKTVKDTTLRLYREAAAFARVRGIIIADTKFEFGQDDAGRLHLIDEVLTPDSSRFWPADRYKVGISPPSFDKQFVRDYLETLDWNKQAPGTEAAAGHHRQDRGQLPRSADAPGRAAGDLMPKIGLFATDEPPVAEAPRSFPGSP